MHSLPPTVHQEVGSEERRLPSAADKKVQRWAETRSLVLAFQRF